MATEKPTKAQLSDEALTSKLTIRLPVKLREQLRKRAFTLRVEPSELARQLLHESLKRVQV